jgi:hypothetical protein
MAAVPRVGKNERAHNVIPSLLSGVRIDDAALEAEFVKSATTAQRGAHRVYTAMSVIMAVLVMPGQYRFHVSDSPDSVSVWGYFVGAGWVVVLGYFTWLLASFAALHCAFVYAKHATVEAYGRRLAGLAVVGATGCYVSSIPVFSLMEQAGTLMRFASGTNQGYYPADALTHLVVAWQIGWASLMINCCCALFFVCSGVLQRAQAVLTMCSLVAGAAIVLSTSPDPFSRKDVVFVLTHSACSLGCTAAFRTYSKLARRDFLYSRSLEGALISEREQNAEAKALGEQAVCAWVCHEM